MTNVTTQKPPMWFLVISIIALIWNALGVMAYLGQTLMTDEMIAQLPKAEQDMYANLPSWYLGAFAIAVFAGTIGSLALVLKKKWAFNVLLISLVAAIIQMCYLAFVIKMTNAMTPMIILVGIALVWLSDYATKKGWLS
ncbi:hypothetical protein DZC78_01855 [Olleya aquimaris]|uniref:Sugar transporter n=1 Tax=Olleya sediminilitoris TaxID=2795739 RepID=A0ABS1WMG7_9FLAO|nr:MULTISPECIES: hypothetical protein [Olleya]AXO79176.1 hypothetical protein DZC78_01855 [Olleya aquimaris]MBL7560322.1 hypothetical protein [Olleya sediminilitoris]